MFLIDKETLEIVAEVSHEWVVEHKEMWFDGVLDELNLAIVQSWVNVGKRQASDKKDD